MVRTPFPALRAAVVALPLVLAGAGPAVAAVPAGNLVVNGGAEYGPQSSIIDFPVPEVAGWTRTNERFRTAPYDAPGSTDGIIRADDPGASGCRLFYGGTGSGNTPSGAAQEIDVAGAAAEIDGGTVTAKWAARLGNAGKDDGDSATLQVAFLGAGGSAIATATLTDGQAAIRTSAALSPYADAAVVPAGTRRIRLTITQTALANFDSYNDGYVDDVGLTLDGSDPSVAPPAGCQLPVLTTGAATDVTSTSARFTGVVDNKHEDVAWRFRFSTTSPVQFGQSTDGGTVPASAGPQGVGAVASGLSPNTTYYGVLVADHPSGGTEIRGAEVAFRTAAPPGATPVPTPTPTPVPPRGPRFDTFKTAVRITAPSCIKKGSRITVTVRDASEGTRKLRRFIVQAGTGIGTPKETKGRTGVTSSTVVVKRFPTKAPKNTRGAKLILSVIADFGDAPGFGPNVDSDQSISGQKQIRFCKPAKKKKKRRR